MIVFGTRTKAERVSSIPPFKSYCPACRRHTDFVVKSPVKRFTLYWIPTLKIGGGKNQFQECQACENAYVYDESKRSDSEEKALPLLLVSAAAHVINADGVVEHEEIGAAWGGICALFRFEEREHKEMVLSLLLAEIENPSELASIGKEISEKLQSKAALELTIEILLSIAIADGELHETEVKVVARVANSMGLPKERVSALVASYRRQCELGTDLLRAYELMSLEAGCTLADAKRRRADLLQQYHPDKVAGLGPEIRNVAETKTREILSAYEEIVSTLG